MKITLRAAYLDPFAYADLITKVCFMGAPSTGKTTSHGRWLNGTVRYGCQRYGAAYWNKHQVDRRIRLNNLKKSRPSTTGWKMS